MILVFFQTIFEKFAKNLKKILYNEPKTTAIAHNSWFLQPFTRHQPRQIADSPHRMTHQKAFGRRDFVDDAEAYATHRAQGFQVIGKQAD